MIQNTSIGNALVNAINNVTANTITPAEKIPVLRDQRRLPMLAPSLVLTKNVPIIEDTIPIDAMKNGRIIASEVSIKVTTETRVRVAIIDPT